MKQRIFVFLAVAMVLVFALAVSVTGMTLLPGQPFSLPVRALRLGSNGGALGGGETFLLILRIMLALSLIALPIYIITSILTKEGRRRLLGNIVAALVLALMINVVQRAGVQLPELTQPRTGLNEKSQNEKQTAPVPEPPPPPSDWVVYAAAAGISLLIVAVALGLFFAARQRPFEPDTMQELGDDAQKAIDALRAGDALDETIQRCYHDMCEVLTRERGVTRSAAMTPHEFEQTLNDKGLPRGAVHSLTSLFEQIRYGGVSASAREQSMAIESLSAIVAACAQSRTQSQAKQPSAA